MRFWNYLYEKISRDEVKEALNNDNIIVGAEFEFISDEMSRKGGGSSRQQAYDDWDVAMEAYRDWMDDLQSKEERITELEQAIEDIKDKMNDLEDEIEDAEDEEDKETFQDQYNDLKTQLQVKQDDLENVRQEDPRPEPALEDYLDKYEERDLQAEMEMDEVNQPTHPDHLNLGSIDDEEDWVEIAKSVVPTIVSDVDFIKDYEIGGYGDIDQGEGIWAFEFDSSIAADGGIEMKSPPMKLPDFIEILPKVFDFIGNAGGTNSNCGLHFHMSFPSASEVDMAKLILFTEEEYIYLFFPERVNSTYAKEIKSKVEKASPEEIKDYFEQAIGKQIKIKEAQKLIGQHHDAVRKITRDEDETHVEFRYLGGADYHTKEDDVRHLVGRYAHTLSLAVDPEYKHQEYVKKMIRVFNKIEVARYQMLQMKIDDFVKHQTLDKLIEKYNVSEETKKKIVDYLSRAKEKAEKKAKSMKVETNKSLMGKISTDKIDKKLHEMIIYISKSDKFPKTKDLDRIVFEDTK